MPDPVGPTVAELIELLARGDQPAAVTGMYRWLDSEQRQRTWKAWRRGRLARIEEPPGVLALIAGERTYWMSWPPADGIVAVPRNSDIDDFELSALTKPDPHTYWRSWLLREPETVEATLHRVEHDGRAAWQFVAPEAEGARCVLTVDERTGLLVRAEHPEAGVFKEWWDLSDEVPDDETFAYHGEWQRAAEFSHRYPPDWQPT
ncbi:hypothetical protein [Nocardioides pelophilus]|uniref:hypothetical protein n=1 Tax=Nocardioides pelophilus TaxID=2172019 RepID=UPI001602ED92|nr:hypothetical protein [Nocardioides pelophilus]